MTHLLRREARRQLRISYKPYLKQNHNRYLEASNRRKVKYLGAAEATSIASSPGEHK